MDTSALFRFGYGLYVLTTSENHVDNGCIINTAIQITAEPLRILVAVNKQNKTHDMIMQSREFNISMIAEDASFDLFRHFGFQSGKQVNKFADYTACKRSKNGLYYITEGTNAYVCGSVVNTLDVGTHTIFIAEVTDADVLRDIPTATYTYYQEKIKPKNQETVQKDSAVWVCKVCGYVYEGDPLPADYVCPICKHGAMDFEKKEAAN